MHINDLFALKGRTALVTGGSAGIGRAIAEGLGEAGARVAIVARKEAVVRATEAELAEAGLDVRGFVADVGEPDAVAPLVHEVLEHFGGLDILVNNAGTNWIAPAEDYPDKGWEKVMGVCVDGPFRLAREIGRQVMLPRRSGRIINVGSTAALGGNGTGTPGGGHFIGYHAAKGALHSLTRGLAVEWGGYGITVNCLCPGFISTEGAAAFQESVREAATAMTPSGRFGSYDDIKGAAVFLASDAAAFVNGHTLVVDGGISIV